MSLTTGEIIEGKYRIVRLIGEGGMGSVYEGENIRIHRRVAIKVLHQGVAENQEAVQRFEHEAQAAGRIGNDHILEVLDLGELANGDHFMVMEYLDGEPLSDRIRRVGRMRPEDIARLMIQALEGLQAAHAAGIVHRDLKPDNVFVLKGKAGQRDFVKLIDFGISKFQPLGGSEMKMTRTGTVMGTPYYMSPEQASGSRDADHRSDLYAIGVMLYEAVVGRVPFDAPTFNQLLFQIVLSDPAPPQQVVPELDSGFASLIAKAMARDVEHRFQSAVDLSNALDAWLKTGASVSVPPAVPMNPLVPRSALGSAPTMELGTSANRQGTGVTTPEKSWATSQLEAPGGIVKSKVPIYVGAAAASFVILGLAFGAYKILGGDRETALAVVTAEPVVSAQIPQVTAPSAAAPTVVLVASAEPTPASTASARYVATSAPLDKASTASVPVTAPGKPKTPAQKGSKQPPTTAQKGAKENHPATPAKPPPRGQSGPVDFGY